MLRKKITRISLGILVVLLGTGTALASLRPAQPVPVITPTPNPATFVAQTVDYGPVALALNREKWAAQNINHYRFTVRFDCMCADGASRIEVKDNVAIAIIAGYDAGAPLEDNPAFPTEKSSSSDMYLLTLRTYSTIDKIFDGAYASVQNFHGEYDPTFGYPTSMCLGGCLGEGNDPTDPIFIDVTDFEKLP